MPYPERPHPSPGHAAASLDPRVGARGQALSLREKWVMTVLPLLAWLSPAYPGGAYAYSHGLEWAAEAGDIADEASVAAWLADVLGHGVGRNDAILLAAAHRAAVADDSVALIEVNDLALALAPSQE